MSLFNIVVHSNQKPLYKGGIEQNQPTKQAVSAERKNGIQFHRENVHCIVSADLKYNKTHSKQWIRKKTHTHTNTYARIWSPLFSLCTHWKHACKEECQSRIAKDTQQHLLCQPPHAANNTDAPRFFSPFPSHSLLFSLLSFNRFNCQHDYPGMIIIILCVCFFSRSRFNSKRIPNHRFVEQPIWMDVKMEKYSIRLSSVKAFDWKTIDFPYKSLSVW